MGIAALASTMSQTEQSASDSISQAESIASSSSEYNSNSIIENISIENVIDKDNNLANKGNSDLDSDVEVTSTQKDLELVQSILANVSQSNADNSSNTFDEDEQLTIQNDPNLSNAFNVIPNTANLEIQRTQ